mmetsp:Transcript_18946/g.21717  ORF Transcript_18946/g.21717 Transcript_18946/m.21717 type:complete len:98 (+) Transcript_18946:77-370(+)
MGEESEKQTKVEEEENTKNEDEKEEVDEEIGPEVEVPFTEEELPSTKSEDHLQTESGFISTRKKIQFAGLDQTTIIVLGTFFLLAIIALGIILGLNF